MADELLKRFKVEIPEDKDEKETYFQSLTKEDLLQMLLYTKKASLLAYRLSKLTWLVEEIVVY